MFSRYIIQYDDQGDIPHYPQVIDLEEFLEYMWKNSGVKQQLQKILQSYSNYRDGKTLICHTCDEKISAAEFEFDEDGSDRNQFEGHHRCSFCKKYYHSYHFVQCRSDFTEWKMCHSCSVREFEEFAEMEDGLYVVDIDRYEQGRGDSI